MVTPLVLAVALFDAWALSHLVQGYDGIVLDPSYDDVQLEYADRFGARVRHTLLELAGQPAPSLRAPSGVASSAATANATTNATANTANWAGTGRVAQGHKVVWGAACYTHDQADRAGFLSRRARSQTPAELLAAFLDGAPWGAWPASDIAECTTFNCGAASCAAARGPPQ